MSNIVTECYTPCLISATTQFNASFEQLGYIVCSASTAGTVTIYDSATSGTTNKIVDAFPLVAGSCYPFLFGFKDGIYIVIGGAATITVGVA